MKSLLLALLGCLLSASLFAAQPYHLQLEANPAAPFPFLSRFGTVTIDVYGGGVRAETIWLNGFSPNGAGTVTVENPLGRMYTDLPLGEIAKIVRKLGGASLAQLAGAPERVVGPVGGKVKGLNAERYRLYYGPEAWVDVWNTRAIPSNPQFRSIVNEFVSGVAPGAAPIAARLPGATVYVELNFRRFHKLPLLRMKSLTLDNAGEASALKTGALYFKAPLLDSLWK